MNKNVVSIIVLYAPEKEVCYNIEAIAQLSYKVIVVVNQCEEGLLSQIATEIPKALIIKNDYNIGLSKALNTGIKYALEHYANEVSYLAFFDQDSLPIGEDFFDRMLSVFQKEEKVGSVGAVVVDKKGASAASSLGVHRVDTIITSGSVIPIGVLREVGFMDETLFIDYIDYEWCLRAIHKGYSIYLSDSKMQHNMGDVFVKFLWMKKPYHKNKIRQYYIVRNGLIMLGRDYIDWKWKCKHFLKLLYRIPMYYFLSDNKKTTSQNIKQAFNDYFRNKKLYANYQY
jgi:rhamnosyltransferase